MIGFSQGACLAIDFALRLKFSIGGIVAIAGFIKFKERFLEEASKESGDTPILLMHGNQDDIIPMPPGFTYERCFPPKIEVVGRGAGAILVASISKTDNSIFSIEVVDGGMGYDDQTSISIIDNTNLGSGATAEPVIENGKITSVIVLSRGSGYCGAMEPVGIVSSIHPVNPGLGYTSGDTISIIDNDITIEASVVVTPNGSIVRVDPPTDSNHEYTSTPVLKINTNTGYGANFVPVMKDIQVTTTDSAVRPLGGITSVIDCPTEDHRGM